MDISFWLTFLATLYLLGIRPTLHENFSKARCALAVRTVRTGPTGLPCHPINHRDANYFVTNDVG